MPDFEFVSRYNNTTHVRQKYLPKSKYFLASSCNDSGLPQLLGHIGLQNMKVGVKLNFGRLATISKICAMDADILS